MNSALFSSKTGVWETPQWLFDDLDAEFNFNLDPCALPENAKCSRYFTPADDGLKQDWGGYSVFCNPPYGRGVYEWVRKAAKESKNPNTTVVMLLPARTDTRYFHEFIYNKAREVRFLKGRLKFGKAEYPAPFPSMVVIF